MKASPRPVEEIAAEFRAIINAMIVERLQLEDQLERLLDPAADEHF